MDSALLAASVVLGLLAAFFAWRWRVALKGFTTSSELAIAAAARNDELSLKNATLQIDLNNTQRERLAAEATVDTFRTRFGGIVDDEAAKQKLIQDITAETESWKTRVVDFREKAQDAISRFQKQQQEADANFEAQKAQHQRMVDADLAAKRGETEGEINSLKVKVEALRTEFAALDEESNLREFGYYKPHYDFESSERYLLELNIIREKQKKMLKDKTAAVGLIKWTVNGSEAEGRKQINQTLRLLLRAFNGESDAAIAKVKYNNISVMETRIRKAYEAINGLAVVQQCVIAQSYFDLKIQELRLAHEWQEKVQAEKEEQRRIREQMREEEVARREIEKAQQDAEKEEERYAHALRKAMEEADQKVGAAKALMEDRIADLQRKLTEAQENKQRAPSRAQMTRSGHVYVISNIGSFGETVYKIGMTRRLDPLDRVNELGDASVPFKFDVHAMIWADDAPGLEAALHRKFDHLRVNRINGRKEFFKVSLDEIKEVVKDHHGEIEFMHEPPAEEYRKTLALLKELGAAT